MVINLTSSKKTLLLSGVVLEILACTPVHFGSPKSMAICVACFIRDSASAVKLHIAAVVQYFKSEVVDFVCGSSPITLITGEYRSTAGSSPTLRFILGVIMMTGPPAFLGCSLRMVVRMTVGDLDTYVRFFRSVASVFTGTVALKHGFSPGRAHEIGEVNGVMLPVVLVVLFILSLTTTLFVPSEKGSGSMHVPALLAPAMILLFGTIAQKYRTCFAGSIRDVILVRNSDLITMISGLSVVMLVFNLATGGFGLSFAGQPAVHSQRVWDTLGLCAVGFAAVLAGGCPLRQLVLAGQSSSDSAAIFPGLLVGAIFCRDLRLAASAAAAAAAGTPAAPDGLAMASRVAVIGCIVILFTIGFMPKPQEGKQEVRDTYGVGARGLSCPGPVMLAAATLKKHKEEPAKMLTNGPHIGMNVEKYIESQGKTAVVTRGESEFGTVIG